MDLLNLPIVMVENIFSYLSYDEIAKNRIVCKSFNVICMRMLNRGFMMIERQHGLSLKNVKAQLPRRESERRYHPLSRHCDILSSIETRISMLNMTYSKFIDNGLCCFIPGKVIDEIRRILQLIDTANNNNPPRAHEVLQELRDISSMAIEHFDDKISPAFRKKLQEGVAATAAQAVQDLTVNDPTLGPLLVRQELMHLRRRYLINNKLSVYIAMQYKKFHKKITTYRDVTMRQLRTIKQLTLKQREQDATIADLKKRIEECDIKYSELTHTNQAAGGKAIAGQSSGSDVVSSPTQQLRHFGSQIKLDLSVLPIGTSKRSQGTLLSNIKPRKPLIKLPSLSDEDSAGPPPPKQAKREDSPTKRFNGKPSTSKTERIETTKRPNAQTNDLNKNLSNIAGVKDFLDSILSKNTIGLNSFRLGKRSYSLSQVDDCNAAESIDSPKKLKRD